MRLTEQFLSPLPHQTLERLRRADQVWQEYRQNNVPTPTVVRQGSEPLAETDWDVVIAGGTLGILMAAALAQRGWRVALIERGPLRGREQEWNISRRELQVLVELELLTETELEAAIATEYNPARIQFHGGPEFWVRDVLNVGVDPVVLLETLKTKFLAAGGHLAEHTAFESVVVHPDGVKVEAGPGFKARLMVDAMGQFSPIVRQVRQGRKPDGVCLVVGTCAQGLSQSETGDLIVSFTPIQNQCQYFWEAFPAKDGRTTYLFTYVDAHPSRPSLEYLFEDYLTLLPTYQDVDLEQLQIQRALFGFFPCYRQSPLCFPFDRLLPIGDSSSNQSPLSFGGFGAMMRHLQRLTDGIDEALRQDLLRQVDLQLLQPYQPNLAVTWLFQRSMSVAVEQSLAPNQINDLLSGVFQEMAKLGEDVLKPFMQDVVQFPALAKTLLKTSLAHPGQVGQVIPQVGIANLLDWTQHYMNLAAYSGLNRVGQACRPWLNQLSPQQQYYWHRRLEAWQYGAGADYRHHA